MGWYYNCSTCGLSNKYGPGCNCAETNARKSAFERIGSKIVDSYVFSDGNMFLYEKLETQTGETRYSSICIDSIGEGEQKCWGGFGEISQEEFESHAPPLNFSVHLGTHSIYISADSNHVRIYHPELRQDYTPEEKEKVKNFVEKTFKECYHGAPGVPNISLAWIGFQDNEHMIFSLNEDMAEYLTRNPDFRVTRKIDEFLGTEEANDTEQDKKD